MGIPRVALRSISNGLSRRFQQQPYLAKALSTNANSGSGSDGDQNSNPFESADEFEKRIFGGISGSNSSSDAFFQKLDRLEKARDRLDSKWNGDYSSQSLDGLDESFDTLSDGMDDNLEQAATYFEFDPDEVDQEDYAFRSDINVWRGMTYDVKDLDLTKPGVRRTPKRFEFEVTTEEVLRKADFRNVRFLANFITEAGIIIKRSKTGISAKAQRKVAREIKTARAFGLMPFTTMGTKSFVFGTTMEHLDKDYEYETFDAADGDEKDTFEA